MVSATTSRTTSSSRHTTANRSAPNRGTSNRTAPIAGAAGPPSEPIPPGAEWLSLTELGRLHGISAVHCGRQLIAAGLRQSNGAPTSQAVHDALAMLPHPRAHHRSALWHREGCGRILQQQGMQPLARGRLVRLWADLLEALLLDSAAISTSAEEMASEMPRDLVGPVNQELEQRGNRFRVRAGRRPQPSRRASACLRARSSISLS